MHIYYLFSVCMCTLMRAYVLWRSKEKLRKSIFSFLEWIWGIELRSSDLVLLPCSPFCPSHLPPHPPPPPALWDSVRCVTSPGRGTHNIDQADWKLTEIPSARLLWAKEWIPGQPGYTKTLSHQQSKKCKQSKTIATAEPQSLWGSNTWAGNWVSVVASSPQWGSESLSICLSDRVPLFWWVGYCLFEIQSFLCIPFLSINAVVTLRAVFREGQMMSAAFLFTLS